MNVLVLSMVFAAVPAVQGDAPVRADGVNNREVDKDVEEFEPPVAIELQGMQILDKVGARIPTDVTLTDHEGKTQTLKEIAERGRPIVLVLGYYRCPTLCSAILNGAFESLNDLSLVPTKDYELVVVSIDPKETQEVAADKRANYIKEFGVEGSDEGWRFYTAPDDDIRRLADAVGFKYRWDDKGKQYIHAGGIFFLSPWKEELRAAKFDRPDGSEKSSGVILSRTLWGMTFKPRDVKFALIDASEGKVGSVLDKVWLSCFSYTPDSQRYSVYIWGSMRLAGIITLVLLASGLFYVWRRVERRRRRTRRKPRA